MVEGQINLRDAIRRTITFTNPDGKEYRLNEKIAVLLVRPRGWHLVEKHMLVDGEPVAGGLFDFGLYFFHNAKELIARGSGPYFYLPKMESHLEARIWNDVFKLAQDELGIPQGTIRATVLIETIPAAFEMDEILYELREHSAGLNCGRWDYIFSCIKRFRNKPDFLLADRALITMTTHFMHSYSLLCIKTCHRRGHFRDGRNGGADPGKKRPGGERRGVRQSARGQGTRSGATATMAPGSRIPAWFSSRSMPLTRKMPQPNQIDRKRDDVNVSAKRPARFWSERTDHRGGFAAEHQRWRAISRGLAARQRGSPPLQFDGRRSHRGNLTGAGLAMDSASAKANSKTVAK